MPVVKTAVSLPAGLFKEASALAAELKIPRSRLVAMAVREFLEKRRSKRMFDRLNAAWADGLSEEDRILLDHTPRGKWVEEWDR
jgi:hypothetical protein